VFDNYGVADNAIICWAPVAKLNGPWVPWLATNIPPPLGSSELANERNARKFVFVSLRPGVRTNRYCTVSFVCYLRPPPGGPIPRPRYRYYRARDKPAELAIIRFSGIRTYESTTESRSISRYEPLADPHTIGFFFIIASPAASYVASVS